MASNTASKKSEKHLAGALDVRNIIGALLTIYGVILTLMGIFADTAEEKTGSVNANLYAGIALLVVGIGFVGWARVRPVVVPEHIHREDPAPH